MTASSRMARTSLIVGVIALVITAVAALRSTEVAFQSYLYSYLFWSDLPIGALGLMMIYPLTGGRWGASVRKILEALSDTMGYAAIGIIPILIGLKWIYPWMSPDFGADSHVAHKQVYLSQPAFIVRTVIYFACWILLNRFIKRYSAGFEKNADPRIRAKLKNVCAGGLVLFGFTVSLAAVDWQMSVEPAWYSTVYGMLFVIGQSLGAFAAALVVFGLASASKQYSHLFTKKTLRDLGNILLTLVILWAYLSFIQYLVVWSGNLPHEATWYIHRSKHGWQWIALMLLIFQFSAPFLFLLFRATKDKPKRLAWLGLLVLCARALDHYWMLIPGLTSGKFALHWEAVSAWVGIGGVWAGLFIRKLNSQPLFAEGDPDWPEAIAMPKSGRRTLSGGVPGGVSDA